MRKQPLLSSAVVLALELEQSVDRDGWHWTILASRPGRDGQFRKSWSNPKGRLASDQANDLAMWASQVIYGALEAWGGIQDPGNGR